MFAPSLTRSALHNARGGQRAHPGGRRRRGLAARGARASGRSRGAAVAAVPLTIVEPRPGLRGARPGALVARACWRAASRVLRAGSAVGRVLAVCICGLTRTQVLLDKRRRALGPAILFRDRRAFAVAREMSGMTAFDAPARLAWIARHQPARSRRIDAVVEPKDFLNFRLTGAMPGELVTPWRAGRRGAARRAARAPDRGPGVRGRDGHLGVGGGLRRGASRAGVRRRGHLGGGRPCHRASDRSAGPAFRSRGRSPRTRSAGRPRPAPIARAGAMRRFACRPARARRGARRSRPVARGPPAVPALPCGRARAGVEQRGARRLSRRRPRKAPPTTSCGRCWKVLRWPCATSSTTRRRVPGSARSSCASREAGRARPRGAG